MTPTELLVNLHSVATAPAGPTLRQLITAVDGCVADKVTFHEDVLASALQQLLPRCVAGLVDLSGWVPVMISVVSTVSGP